MRASGKPFLPLYILFAVAGCSEPAMPGEDAGPTVRDGGVTEDAGPPEPCDPPGTVEDVACGSCGHRERFCTVDRVWSYGLCEGEGACAPGSSDRIACGMCGSQTVRCTTECTWDTSTGACEDEGECAPGESSRTTDGCPAGESRELTCDSTCTYLAGPCGIDECAPGAMTTAPCGMCGTLVRTCSSARAWIDGACTGEGVCAPGTTGTQPCGMCGSQGTRCDTSCTWVPSEACMGEGACAAGTTSSCVTSCGTTGTRMCSPSCIPGPCMAPVELCNGVDDDCDGMTDEACVRPPNDLCAGAIRLVGAAGTRTGDVFGGATQQATGCGLGGDIYYAIALSVPSILYVDTFDSTFDTRISLRSTCTGTAIDCRENDCSTQNEQLVVSLAAGDYYVVVHASASATITGSVSLRWQTLTAPGGVAQRIGANGTYTGTTAGTGVTAGACGGATAPENLHYFTLCPATTRTIMATTCSLAAWDTVLYLRRGGDVDIGCNDDACSIQSTISASTSGPGLFGVYVDGFSTYSGAYSVTVSGF